MTSEEISNTLRLIRDGQQTALQNGLQTRDEIRKQLEAGNEPEHYRIDWLRETAVQCIGFIGEASKIFNAQHPNDQISQNDVLDVLINAANMIVKYSGAGTLIVSIKPND